jgi:superfamily II DNA or RNA helicase
MKLDVFLKKHGSKMRHLETIFLKDVFYKDFGEQGLDLISPEVEISRNDGTSRKWRIDFVVETINAKYAIECNGFNYHAAGMVSKERFDELQEKSNEIVRLGYQFINLSRDQIEIKPEEAIYQLRRSFIADESLYSIFLKRNSGAITPHEVQEEALENLIHTRETGHTKGLVVFATGLGKTYLSGFDAIELKSKRILFIVHVGEILKQARRAFEDIMPERAQEMGFYTGSEKDKEKNILFATIQTLTRLKNLEQFDSEEFDYIVLDETHHIAAPSYKRICDYFNPRFFLGLTATPNRMDQQDILRFYEDNLVYEIEQIEAVKKGLLASFNYKGFKDNIDYSNIHYNGFKYDTNDLNRCLMIDQRDRSIIEKFKELAFDKKTIGFCASTEYADWCAKKFREQGIKAVAIHSNLDNPDLPIEERDKDRLIADFKNSKHQVAFVVDMFNEGVDVPDVGCLLLLRPTESITILTQQIGRGLRISPGKKEVIILDFIGNYQTAHKILPALGIHNIGELKYDAVKCVYYYDNDGRKVTFESEVVEIFRMMLSRSSKKVRAELLDPHWIEYGKYLEENTKPGSKLHWKIGNKNDHIGVHFWALNYLNENSKNKSASQISEEIREKSKSEFSGKTMEGTRALFLSKLLGFLKDTSPVETTGLFNTEIGKYPQAEQVNNVMTKQLEKFYFWNDLFSLTNRHVSREEQRAVDEYFAVYPLFFIYEVIIKLKEQYGYENLSLSKFEVSSFVVLARNHSEINTVVERIVEYREHEEKYEIEKYLKQINKLDARFYKILRYCKYFQYNLSKITLIEEYFQEVSEKVLKFNELIKENKLIKFDKNSPGTYRDMLYSKEGLLEYHDLLE